MTLAWENDALYRRVLYAGCAWNLAMAIPLFVLVPYLPGLLRIEEPRFPVFIYFNLMTIGMFGWVHAIAARHLAHARPFIKVLMWSKLLTAGIFVLAIFFAPMPAELAGFLGPGMAIDLGFGLAFWRYLCFSKARSLAA